MKVSIIIPNFNGATLLKKNLPAIQKAAVKYEKHSGNSVQIIIADDASTDDSKRVALTIVPEVLYLEHDVNTGFATNVNRGVKKAMGEIIVLLNTDVTPKEDFLIPLVKHFSEDAVFAVGCLERDHDKKEQGRGIGKWEKGFLVHSAGDVSKHDTLWASGGSSAFRRSTWEDLGGLYEIYSPFYWEDIDVSYRALKSGKQVLFEPESVVMHAHDEGAIKTQFKKRTITATAYRNQFFFVWLNITDAKFLLSHFFWLPIHFFQAALRQDAAFFIGFGRALIQFPQALFLRKKNRKHFFVADSEILRRFAW